LKTTQSTLCSFETLLRELFNVPDPGKPPIGSNPFGAAGTGDVVVGTGECVGPPATNAPSDEPLPQSDDDTEASVAKLKVLISQPSHPMQLNDLLMPVANEARSAIERSGALDYSAPPSQEKFVQRVRAADEATNKLSNLFAVGCHWANADQGRTFMSALRRIVISPNPQGMFYEAWMSVARYPALRVMYSGGVTACANDSFGVLSELLIQLKVRPGPHEPEAPLVKVLHHGAGFMQRHWKWLPGRERHFVPTSDYLEESLRPALRRTAHDDEEISSNFDRFEFFQALIYGDIAGEESMSPLGFWAPLAARV
jgi:hypothetical protein